MRTQAGERGTGEGKQRRTSGNTRAETPPARPGSSPPQGYLVQQRAVGNAAVVQMLRDAAHRGAQEQHRHGDGCGHQQSEQAAPAVQRSAVHDVLRTGGRPLDDATRTDMENRLGADFSDVRIHDDSAAKASAAEVGARAYTSGSHVVIGDGGDGKHTLAHELTHVIQQRQGPVAGTDNGSGLRVSDPSDRFEREAEANATRAMRGPAPVQLLTDGREEAVARRATTEPAVQRTAAGQATDLQFRTHTLDAGTVAFKGGDWADGQALIAAAATFHTNGEWGACYLGTPANVSVGYMEEGNSLLQITLTEPIKLLEIYGRTADEGSIGGEEKAAMVKAARNYPAGTYLMDSILADGFDGAYMNADDEGRGNKEIILHWSRVAEVCEAVLANPQPQWNRREYRFNDLP